MTAESLRSSFSDLGVDVDEESLQECVRVCEERGVDADTLVEAWVAFSLSALRGAAPTVEKVRQLERKEFGDGLPVPAPAAAPTLSSTVYDGDFSKDLDDSGVIANYISSTTPKRVKQETVCSNADVAPAIPSPSVGPSAKYANRKNAGSVVLSYGDESSISELEKARRVAEVKITQLPNEDGAVLGSKAMFGFDVLHEIAGVLDNQTRYLSQCIMRKHGIKQTSSVRCKSQTEIFVAGRVDCDADARLNAQSVVLHGMWEESLGQSVPLSLELCPQYGLFPGQTVVARGTNPRGDRFLAQEVYTDATLPLYRHKETVTLDGPLTILATSGPYTPSDSLHYEPLKDFLSYVSTHKPHVVIMTGPFVDADHALVKSGALADTYKAFFEKLIDSIAEVSTNCPQTKFLIVSSLRDAFHHNVFPTPAYRVSPRRRLPGLTFLPDPCTLDIDGVAVGVTSTDVLMHLSQEEIALGGPTDKLRRLCGAVLSQQSYAPLCPAPASQPTDAALWAAHAHLPATPHLLLLPSNLRYFAKEVSGCVVVNPEHLTKGSGGGTFARIRMASDKDSTKPVVSCQIIRI